MKAMFKMLMAALVITSLSVFPVSAAKEESVDWGNAAYRIIVPGFIEGRDVEVGDGKTTPAIVVEKPAQNSNGRYTFLKS